MTRGGKRRWPQVALVAAVALWLTAGAAGSALGQATTLRIPGTGDSEELLRAVGAAFAATAPDITVEVPDSVGSTGGIKALLAGKAELARAARPLRNEERNQGLVEFVFAETPVVFAVNPSVTGVAGLTSAQALDVYAGKITDWSALGGTPGPIARVSREMPETSRAVLNAAIAGFEALSTEGQVVAYSTPEAVDMVRRNPGTIGYFSLTSMTGAGLVPLVLGDVPPTPEALATAPKAPRIRLSLVYRSPLSPAGERFLAFLQSPQGAQLLTRFGCRPLAGEPSQP
jgi:phosphate transport system substrate-binding protein